MDTYDIYAEWFERHYGRAFGVTREEWRAWCMQPRYVPEPMAEQREADRERAEGWALDLEDARREDLP